MSWYLNYGNIHLTDPDRDPNSKPLSTIVAREAGKQPGTSDGPFPSEFKVRGAVEQQFGGISNIRYNPDKRGGVIVDYPYWRTFEIFEYE